MSLSLFPGRIHCLRRSLPLTLTRCGNTTLASSNAPSQASPPNPHFPAVDYLVQSCALTPDDALKASKLISHLKSPDKPDAVLRFLRKTGVREEDITAAVARDPLILCSSVDKNIRPNIKKLLRVGLSIEDVSGIISHSPTILRFNIVAKVDFWLGVLESVEDLPLVLRAHRGFLLRRSLESVIIPSISYLRDNCGFSPRQIRRLVSSSPKIISSSPETLKQLVERAKGLGIDQSSGTFLHALIILSSLSQSMIDARTKNLTNFGFSHEEVKIMIRKFPFLLSFKEELICRKMVFLTNEVGCDKLQLVSYPNLLAYSLENRLIPRTIVWKLLMSKGLANIIYASFMTPRDQQFVEKFVLPNEHAIPGLYQKYVDAKKKMGD